MQDALAFNFLKLVVQLRMGRIGEPQRTTIWPAFIHPSMTWGEFEYAIRAELATLQARSHIFSSVYLTYHLVGSSFLRCRITFNY